MVDLKKNGITEEFASLLAEAQIGHETLEESVWLFNSVLFGSRSYWSLQMQISKSSWMATWELEL